jgi:hypothetical protein
MEPGVSDDAGAVYRCKSEDFTATTVDCIKVPSTEVLSRDFDLIGDGIVLDNDGHLYFTAYNETASYIFKLTGVDRDLLENLIVSPQPLACFFSTPIVCCLFFSTPIVSCLFLFNTEWLLLVFTTDCLPQAC